MQTYRSAVWQHEIIMLNLSWSVEVNKTSSQMETNRCRWKGQTLNNKEPQKKIWDTNSVKLFQRSCLNIEGKRGLNVMWKLYIIATTRAATVQMVQGGRQLHQYSESSYPSLQAHTLTGGWSTWRAATRPDTMIKNGCWCERKCQHDAATTNPCK